MFNFYRQLLLNVRQFDISHIPLRNPKNIYNLQALSGDLKFRTWYLSLTLYTEYEAIEALDT